MAKIGRPGLPSARRQWVWDMWKAGSSISDIARGWVRRRGQSFRFWCRSEGSFSLRSGVGLAV